MNDSKIKNLINVITISIFGVISILFSILFVCAYNLGFVYNYKNVIIPISVILLLTIAVIGIVFLYKNKQLGYKICLLTLGVIAVCLIFIYILKITGAIDKIRTVEELRKWVASFGAWMPVIYIVLNVLQVVILPIPGFVAVATGVALFGPHLATLYSFIGILVGSIIGFYIGRKLGYKVVRWLVGEETLRKWLKAVKNKDRIVLTIMFLLPLFPDDVLCFIAGLSSMSDFYFIIMVTLSRILTISITSYSLNGNLIPYNTWWGILIWAVIIIATLIITIFIYKRGDKIERKITSFFKNKFKGKKSEQS